MDRGGFQLADAEGLAVGEQVAELGAVQLELGFQGAADRWSAWAWVSSSHWVVSPAWRTKAATASALAVLLRPDLGS
ncbi:hypothetical protein G6F60_015421 [Rhizopus arrhizus]|nr:hypothetical protein G6F60_015421 [Rhizopus arrhizus]